ncbi:factor activating pos9 [Sporothrix eucalyptigena]|uniref:Adenylate kinase isoenzyme 6 homolog n=1 Tax=Sporothrix eucalyptigena TaxID=1812306 RepID=A0ABP0AYB8_9PEZI
MADDAAPVHPRRNPNIIITGTPGTGKTTHCEALAARIEAAAEGKSGDADAALTELRHIAVNDVVRDRNCHDGWDAEYQSWLVDEDKLLDELEPDMTSERGGCIVDWHACDLFPASWVDLVVVLTADTESLYDRLALRKYPEAKMQENIDAEIMQVLLTEAHEAYEPQIVVELASNTPDDMEANVDRIVAWVTQWRKDQGSDKKADE